MDDSEGVSNDEWGGIDGGEGTDYDKWGGRGNPSWVIADNRKIEDAGIA